MNEKLNLRGRRPYLKEALKPITLSDLDPDVLNRAIDAGATLQRMGIRVSLGVIDPTISADRLPPHLPADEVVLYKRDFHRDTATVNIPYCRETIEERVVQGLGAVQIIHNVASSHIKPIRL